MMLLGRNEPQRLMEASREQLMMDQILGLCNSHWSLPFTGESLSPSFLNPLWIVASPLCRICTNKDGMSHGKMKLPGPGS